MSKLYDMVDKEAKEMEPAEDEGEKEKEVEYKYPLVDNLLQLSESRIAHESDTEDIADSVNP
jgi:hypothetical protein